MLLLQQLAYIHPNKDVLFEDISLSLPKRAKAALVGNNGSGKSTLLKVIAGDLAPAAGSITAGDRLYYVPQHFGQFNELTVARALRVDQKIAALHRVLEGDLSDATLAALDDDWTIEERCREALQHWGLDGLRLDRPMDALSGGQKTKVFLAGIAIHQPGIVLLDEPSNHLDTGGRHLLYDLIQSSPATLLVVSHDRTLLNLLDPVCELSKRGLTVYGGNYDFYAEQKALELNALDQDIKSREKAIRKAKEVERETAERRQRLEARGKKKQEKAGTPTIMMNTLRNNAEKSTSRLKEAQGEKIRGLAQELADLRKELPDADKMKFGFDDSGLHNGKILVAATGINFSYDHRPLWHQPLTFTITSGDRIALKGGNGSGKTTLVNLILGALEPAAGTLHRADNQAVYIDQEYSLVDNALTVYEQAQQFNFSALQEHEVKIRLSWFLFGKDDWDKPCSALSGGEKMRLILCCLTISNRAPDLIVLDEPTNNLDLQNIAILSAAVNGYQGTLLVISHDAYFLKEVGVEKVIELKA
ncbi:ABC-F family ATP-binding cassette domain-containing protein [Paraflavisolibacter sp. H34]|uniref:ABC-F family ATP-binding cassette domain-containing protein n=1 Tax=Huijunlia imazamoxiresistens TaxID=3127457 RepID=UPI00301B5EA5